MSNRTIDEHGLTDPAATQASVVWSKAKDATTSAPAADEQQRSSSAARFWFVADPATSARLLLKESAVPIQQRRPNRSL